MKIDGIFLQLMIGSVQTLKSTRIDSMSSLQNSKSILRQVRKTLGLNQTEAARILGVTQSCLSKQERKQGTIDSIAKLIEAKGLQAYLVIGDGIASIPITTI